MKAKAIIDAINKGITAGGDPSDWYAAEFEEARDVTAKAEMQWDFEDWATVSYSLESQIIMREDRIMYGGALLEA